MIDESTALFDPGLTYEANARSIIGPDTEVERSLPFVDIAAALGGVAAVAVFVALCVVVNGKIAAIDAKIAAQEAEMSARGKRRMPRTRESTGADAPR